MVSKSQIKLIKSLSQKKFRSKYGLFVVEGVKGIREFLNSNFQLHSLFSISDDFEVPQDQFFKISENELKKISSLKTPPEALAVFEIPTYGSIISEGLILGLDGVRDPGNLGTIIRLCDWFGIETLVCSKDTVDCFNPKVVQATMGSLSRVHVAYRDFLQFLKEIKVPVYGTLLEGENIYKTQLASSGLIIMGNEANGISEEVQKLITRRITIPQFGEKRETESLNVATATAIVLNEFRRG